MEDFKKISYKYLVTGKYTTPAFYYNIEKAMESAKEITDGKLYYLGNEEYHFTVEEINAPS